MKKIKKIVLDGKDGRPILCDLRFKKSEEKQPLIIFCHGFKGYKDWGHFNLISNMLASNDFNVLKFNFSHNGGTIENPIDFPDLEAFGENDYIKELNDLEVVLDAVEHGYIAKELTNWNKKVYLIGHSRGGAIVILKASEDARIDKIVTWASVSDLISRLPNSIDLKRWESSGVFWIKNGRTLEDLPMYYNFVQILNKNRDRLNINTACKKLIIPQLIIHGTSDEAVSISEAKDLQRWNKSSTFIEIESAGHTFGGKHPFDKLELPIHSKILVEKTIDFLQGQ